MFSIQKSILINSTKETIWSFYENPQEWVKWDEPVTSIKYNGSLIEVGNVVTMELNNSNVVNPVITEVTKYKSFSDVSKHDQTEITFSHLIQQKGNKCEVIHTVFVNGFINDDVNKEICLKVSSGLDQTLRNLKKLCEK